jgi:predicted DNA-binding protein (UPF0251 family)
MLIIGLEVARMPRPHCPRRVDAMPPQTHFKPRGVPVAQLEEIQLSVDELEALRLADLEGLYHEDAAARMNVSRPTFGRIVEAARRKVAEALVKGRALKIAGGVVEMPAMRHFQCVGCRHRWSEPFGTGRPKACPECGRDDFQRVDGTRGGPDPRRRDGGRRRSRARARRG